MTKDRHSMWRIAGQAAALTGMAMLGLFDVAMGPVSSSPVAYALPATAVGVALAIATAVVWLPAHRQGSRWLAFAAAVVAACSLAFTAATFVLRDIGPLPAGSATPGVDHVWGLAESCGLLGMIFVVARRAAAGWALIAVAAAGLAVAAMPLRSGIGTSYQLAGMGYALLAAGAATLGMYLRLAATVRQRQLAAMRAQQRAEFARDLHDFIAHHVTGIVVQAQGARYIVERDPQRAATALAAIEQAGAQTMAAMRRMVGVLRGAGSEPDAPLAPLAGIGDIPDLVRQFSASGGIKAELHTDGDLESLPVEISTSTYRVVMEALTNVRQHALDVRTVAVSVSQTPDWLLVRISDDGTGVRPRRSGDGPAFGLTGLTERVTALGGRLRAGPGIGGGWEVDVALPLTGKGVRQ